MTPSLAFQEAFNGLSVASILLLAALGLAFSFGLMKVINMAHGEFMMIGAYTTFVFQKYVAVTIGGPNGAKDGIAFILSIGAAFIIAAALGVLLEMTVIRHLYGRPLDTLLATWGVSLILQQLARSIFGASNVAGTSPTSFHGALTLLAGIRFASQRRFISPLRIIFAVSHRFRRVPPVH